MKKFQIKDYLTTKEIEEKMNNSENTEQFKRWQVIYISRTRRMKAEDLARVVNISKRNVYEIIQKYNKKGPDSLILKTRGGRRDANAYMTMEQEIALFEELKKSTKKGLLILTAKMIKEKVEEKLGFKVSKDYPYQLLERHGWKKMHPPKPRKGKHLNRGKNTEDNN